MQTKVNIDPHRLKVCGHEDTLLYSTERDAPAATESMCFFFCVGANDKCARRLSSLTIQFVLQTSEEVESCAVCEKYVTVSNEPQSTDKSGRLNSPDLLEPPEAFYSKAHISYVPYSIAHTHIEQRINMCVSIPTSKTNAKHDDGQCRRSSCHEKAIKICTSSHSEP